jgi:hypothetical protein
VIRRTTLITLELIAVAVAGVSVGVGLLAWRLSTGPLSINFLTPYLERALNVETEDVLSIRIEGTALTWDGWGEPVQIRATGIQAVREDGAARAAIPEMTIRFGFKTLLLGGLAPTSLEVIGLNLRLVRNRDGRFAFGMDQEAGAAAAFLPGLIDTLLGAPKGGAKNYLSRIVIVDAKLAIVDLVSGQSWRASRTDLSFERDILGLRAKIAVDVDVSGGPAHFDATGIYNRGAGSIEIGVDFAGLDPSALAPEGESLEALRTIKMPLDGVVTVLMDNSGWVASAEFDLRGKSGILDARRLLGAELPIRAFAAHGRVLDGMTRLVIDRASLDFGGPLITLNGDIGGPGGSGDSRIGVVVRDLPRRDFETYWPSDVAVNARNWVFANTVGGVVEELTADIRFRRKGPDGGEIELLAVKGGGRFDGTDVTYLGAQPPVRGVGGSFEFDQNGAEFALTGGKIGALALDSAHVLLLDFQGSTQEAKVSGAVRGALGDILALADRDPYRYVHSLGFHVADISGRAAVRFDLAFPLIDDLPLKDVAVRVEAELNNVTWRDALFGVDLADGALRLELGKSHMEIVGTARLGEAPAKVAWTERFAAKAPFRRRMTLSGMFGTEDRAALGLDIGGYVKGPVAADVTMTTWQNGKSRIEADMELTESWLAIPVLGWQKAPALPGRAQVTVEIDGDRPTEISKFSLETADTHAAGRAVFRAGERGLKMLEVALRHGKTTDATVKATRRQDGSYAIEVMGDRFDASDLLDNRAGADDTELPSFTLEARLGAMYFAPDRFIADAAIVAEHDGDDWSFLSLRGTVGDGKALEVDYLPEESGNRLRITAEDAGAALRAVDIVDTVRGGALEVTGARDPADPKAPFAGKITLKDYRLVDAPGLAKLFSLASLQGIGDLLTGAKGIGFTRLSAFYTYADKTIRIRKGRANGSEVGITAKGTIDLANDAVKMRGTLVPAFTLNSLLGNIPLIGPLFVGEEGSGMFAAVYEVNGPIDDLKMDVNPLAALTPGFLRILFNAFSGDVDVPDDIGDEDFDSR